ncbi:MAG: hypothetical protein DMF30_03990 [Verrucomicrobia bacterium]|nr:MAG: hypothetical protein DMF30_03990 [Verrucomicrobiota bacterium]
MARSAFGSSASATAAGNSYDRGEVDVLSKPTTRGAAAEAAPGATWRGPDAATLRVIFGSTVLLKRSLLGFATGTATVRGDELPVETGNRRARARLKRSGKGIDMR